LSRARGRFVELLSLIAAEDEPTASGFGHASNKKARHEPGFEKRVARCAVRKLG
jgi:hypothetical protein